MKNFRGGKVTLVSAPMSWGIVTSRIVKSFKKLNRKLIILLLAALLAGCGVFPPGVYEIPAGYSVQVFDELGTPVYTVRMAAPIPSPTEEIFPTSIYTPVPTTTASPLPTVTPFPCSVVADSNINMRTVPGGTFIYLIRVGDVLYPNAYAYVGDLKYYRFELPVDNDNPYNVGWAADFFTEQGVCNLDSASPF